MTEKYHVFLQKASNKMSALVDDNSIIENSSVKQNLQEAFKVLSRTILFILEKKREADFSYFGASVWEMAFPLLILNPNDKKEIKTLKIVYNERRHAFVQRMKLMSI